MEASCIAEGSWLDKKPDTSNYLEEKLNDKSIKEILYLTWKEYTTNFKFVGFFRHAFPFFSFIAR